MNKNQWGGEARAASSLALPVVSETDNSCKVCCRDREGRCAPHVDAEGNHLFLRKGKPCTVGFCDMNVSAFSQWECVHGVLGLQMEGNQTRAALSLPVLILV